MDLESFLNNWMQGGRETRAAFVRDLTLLIETERTKVMARVHVTSGHAPPFDKCRSEVCERIRGS